jgi:hypothetical protein
MTDTNLLRSELKERSDQILFSDNEKKFADCIRKVFNNLLCAYVVDWIPEEDSDIYHIVVNLNTILVIECAKDKSSVFESSIHSISDYKRNYKRTKLKNIKLQLAVLLTNNLRD